MKLHLSKDLKYMVAKSDRRNHDGWLPFYIHALDTEAVIRRLIKHYSLDTAWEPVYNMDRRTFIKTASLLALLHDIGKLTAVFQAMIRNSLSQDFEMENIMSLSEFEYRSASPHHLAGECILRKLEPSKEFEPFASIVGAHHGMPPDEGVCKKNIGSYPINYYGAGGENDFWIELWKEWLNTALSIAGFDSIKDVPKPNKKTLVLMSGLLITADWLASDSSKFPLLELDELPPAEYDETRANRAWDKIGFTDLWISQYCFFSDGLFEERFGFEPKRIQKSVLDIVNRIENPGIFILEAPMGCGKTEIALMAAEIFAQKNDKHGVFFGLPTQTTANGIFGRFKKWAEGQSEEFYHSLMLAHANAYFQPAFANMPQSLPDVDEDSGLIVHSFFTGAKQSCMADFVVGTVDRMLMAALKRRHTMLLHFGLSQKVVIIDECHAYDAYMNRYLERGLEWLSAYNVPVILLSATLPPSRRRALTAAYTGVKSEDISFEDETAYPALTWSDGGKIYSKAVEHDKNRTEVQIERAGENDALSQAAAAASAGACVGIICNTVRKAQALAYILQDNENCGKILLYHAQYIMPDRAKKEEQIIKTAGKDSDLYRSGQIIVGTQVLEQSLDIDFDLLITELCPMDLLLQRTGRLFRHDCHIRPDGYKQAKCIIMTPENDEFDKGSEAVYGKWLLMQTEKYLPHKMVLPDDISRLVNNVYEKCDTDTEAEKEAYKGYCWVVEKKKSGAKEFLLKEPNRSKYDPTLDGWLSGSVTDAKAEASVRDGDPSIEVLLMVSDNDKYAEFLPWVSEGEKVLFSECPPANVCKKIAMQRLRLPGVLCNYKKRGFGYIDNTIAELERKDKWLKAWQDSHWLNGELVLFMDKTLTADLNGFRLTYSKEKGLSYERIKEV